MTTYQPPAQPDPHHQPGTIPIPPQNAPAAFSPPMTHPPAPLPALAVQQALEALQRPAGAQQSGAVMAVACGGTDGAPVVAVAVGRSTAAADPVPAAAPPADHTPAGPPASPPADPGPSDGPSDERAPALSSWHAVVAVCAVLTVAIACGVLAVVYPRLAVFWQVIGVFVAAAGAVATVVTAVAAREGRRGKRR
ncbi:hypothetical protein [Streptomyces noursei]|uniref:hypothetical protein n=1 Tax=Streptomyces noursei TaxID=1971 RepID=UPI003813FEA1